MYARILALHDAYNQLIDLGRGSSNARTAGFGAFWL
jgi:hypothetical protein